MKRYRTIDLFLFALMVCGLEAAAHFALRLFPTEAFTFSVVIPITLIVMMRWGAWAALHTALGGLVYSLLNGGGFNAVLVYTLENLLIMANLGWFALSSKTAVRTSAFMSIAYTLTGYILMETGRAVVACLIEGVPFFGLWIRYLTTDALSGVMAVIVILIARRKDRNGSVFYDQMEYLAELAAEKERAEFV